MYSPETQSKMAHLRAKVTDGTITAEELAEACRMMREDRFSALQSQANKPAGTGRGKKAKAPVNVASLFDSLDKI